MALLTLAEAKAQLNIDSTAHDSELEAYVDALTEVIEGYIGPVESRAVTEQINSTGPTMCLSKVPAVSLTSFMPVLDAGTALDVTQLHLDPTTGEVRRLDGAYFSGGPWTVAYVAGRGEVPRTVNVAARILLQHLWRTQYGAARGSVGGGDDFDVNEPIPGWGYAVPNRVLQMLESLKTGPGVA